MSIKRLFVLANRKGKLYQTKKGKVVYFPSKSSAKVVRRQINDQSDDNGEILNWTVSYGPDHWRSQT